MNRPRPEPTAPGEESVWDYPRPPRLEPVDGLVRVVLGGVTIAATRAAHRVLETSHPPNYYLPRDAFIDGSVVPASGSSFCEWKGAATYWTLRGGDAVAERSAWSYEQPVAAFAPIRSHLALYAGQVDACFVDDERVVPQPGDFYGGWITSRIKGPFKGEPGTHGW
jgi:uncharacterized protein (DUF427 family)